MTLQSATIFRSEDDNAIPARAGAYAFLYNPYQLARLGLYVDKQPTLREVSEARLALKRKLQRYARLKDSVYLDGHITMYGPSDTPVVNFAGKLSSYSQELPTKYLDDLSTDEFLTYVHMVDNVSLTFQPLYCGMTVRQGLRDRYFQHKYDYETNRSGTFGGRLATYKLNWDDLVFLCISVTAPGTGAASVALVERHLMLLSAPLLSIK